MEIVDTVMKEICFCPAEFKFHRLFCIILVQEDGYVVPAVAPKN